MMKMTDAVMACDTPKEALLVLAKAIDELREATPADPWSQSLAWDDRPDFTDHRPTSPSLDDNRARIVDGDVVVAAVSQERQDERVEFAYKNKLASFYGPGLTEGQFEVAYAKGGPRWLYHTNREAIMQMPLGLRRDLVADVLLDSPEEAAEMGRDVLKHDESMNQDDQIAAQRQRLGDVK